MNRLAIAFIFTILVSQHALCNHGQNSEVNSTSQDQLNQKHSKLKTPVTPKAPPQPVYTRPSIFSGYWGYLVGANLGVATSGPRAGFDIHIANGRCVDGCGWVSFLAGTDRPWKREYYLGTSLVGMYMGSAFVEFDVKFRDRRFNGFRGMAGGGIYMFFAYLGLGYEAIERMPSLEIGFSAKMPVTSFRAGQ